MDAVTMIEQAQGLGLTLSVADGRLNITGPKTMAAAAMVQRMSPHKAELIAILAPEPAQRQPLPQALWLTGIATLVEARAAQRALSGTYVTACGLGRDDLWYVACPSSGLTKPSVLPYVEHGEVDQAVTA
jgi:hypothetical protein